MIEPVTLSGTPRLIAALLIGILLGMTLVKAGLASRRAILGALQLKNGNAINTMLAALLVGIVLFFAARNSGAVEVHTHTGYFWASILGGALCGVGLLFAGMTPLTAIAALGSGKLQSLLVLAGMALALPMVGSVSDALSKTLYRWDMALNDPPEPELFFAVDNPALYLAGVLIVLIVLVHFTIGDKPQEEK